MFNLILIFSVIGSSTMPRIISGEERIMFGKTNA
jgi:hypothetical protein